MSELPYLITEIPNSITEPFYLIREVSNCEL